jgi:ParB-like chromosome segregation protein Spo0J
MNYKDFFKYLDNLSLEDRVDEINKIKIELSNYSPFKTHPVDNVIWVKSDCVHANDYNPNSVAPPEMKLLENSILSDGYTQPIVTWKDSEKTLEVVDGFHRNRVGKESNKVAKTLHGYLPVVMINKGTEDKNERMASTIRHNRARGKHKVESMSDIVIELARRNWSDSKIAENLGMDQDEVLRLKQINGLADVFSNAEFSMAWDIGEDDGAEIEANLEEL